MRASQAALRAGGWRTKGSARLPRHGAPGSLDPHLGQDSTGPPGVSHSSFL